MSDYIKREDALTIARHIASCCHPTDFHVVKKINSIPSADVVEVTRCEDCIHFDNCAKEIDIVNNGEVHITRIMEWCNHGERADE